MACLQVITKTGIRLHRNLHVCDSCYLPQQNPPSEHHLLFSRVWHSELGTFEVTAHFPRGGRAHTGSSPHSFPALHFPWESVHSDAQRVKWQLWPSPACTSLFQNLAGVTPRSRKHLRCSKLSGPGFHLSNGRTEDNLGKSTDNAPFSFYTICPTLDNLPWHLGRNNIGNSKQNIPEVILVHSVAYVVSNNIFPSLIIFFFGHT